MSPFPLGAIDEVIWRIDEALGTSDAPKTTMRGWLKKANAGDIRDFLAGLKLRLENAKFVLTDTVHQEWLRKFGDPEQIVLTERKKKIVSGQNRVEKEAEGGAK